jgi:hypothetical protein
MFGEGLFNDRDGNAMSADYEISLVNIQQLIVRWGILNDSTTDKAK